MYNILNFGAVGDGITVNTAAIQKAIDACALTGGRVTVPAGIYVTGTLWLKSNVELHLCHGATLLASADLEDYNEDDAYEQNFAYTKEEWCAKHLIIGLECSNVAITGSGTIDGNGSSFYGEPQFFEYYCWAQGLALSKDKITLRPGQLINFVESDNICISDITVKNATAWDIFLYGCRYAKICGVKVINPPTYANTDGINIDMCSYVTISDCIIDTGDDAIAIRCNDKFLKNKNRVTEHITISNCILGSSSSVFRLGIGAGLMRNINVSNIQITRGCIGIHLMLSPLDRYATEFENILFSGITAGSVCHPFIAEGNMGRAENITIRDYRAIASADARIKADGTAVINDVVLDNINITLSEKYDNLNPEIISQRGEIGLLVSGVNNINIHSVRVELSDPKNTSWKSMKKITYKSEVI